MSTINQKVIIKNATPKQIYHGLLNSKMHSTFTGGKAEITALMGETFTAWDGYITGKTIELKKDSEIVQEWQNTDWPQGAAPSIVTFTFKKNPAGTQIIFKQTNVPPSLVKALDKGWVEYYWKPMQSYFDKK